MYEIPNFSKYLLTREGSVIRKHDKSSVTKQERGSGSFKLKNDQGIWKEISATKLQALVCPNTVPDGYVNIEKYPLLSINKDGQVWGHPSKNNPLGVFYTESCRDNDYPRISTSKYV